MGSLLGAVVVRSPTHAGRRVRAVDLNTKFVIGVVAVCLLSSVAVVIEWAIRNRHWIFKSTKERKGERTEV